MILFVWFVPIKRTSMCIGSSGLYDPSGKYDTYIRSYSNITLKDYLFSVIPSPHFTPLIHP